MNRKQTHNRLEELARSYVPEWRFSTENPDTGSVLAILIDDMLNQSEKRLARALGKHHIQYLNLFDRIKEEPVEAARCYARFTQVNGTEDPVPVPRGTRLFAEDEETGERLVFETVHGITTTPAELQSVCTTDRQSDRIARLYDGGEGACRFEAFGLEGENEANHCLILSYESAFDAMESLEFGLLFGFEQEGDAERGRELLSGPSIRYSMLDSEGEHPFDRVERREDLVWLGMDGYLPGMNQTPEGDFYQLCIRAAAPLDLKINACSIVFSGQDIPADEVYCSSVSQSVGRFLPFGSPMEIFSECGIECRRVFARKGAAVEMSFDLDYEVYEQLLPEAEEDLDLKVIMKQPVQAPRIETLDIHADSILIEYYSERGWKRLLLDEHMTLLMNGSAKGPVTIRFTCPGDLVGEADHGRLRFRLMRADNLYRIPCRQLCPVVRNLRFSFSYQESRLEAERAEIQNNFARLDITDRLQSGRDVTLFYSEEIGQRSMYLGFNKNPKGMPLSLYFEIENEADYPLDYAVECLTGRGFESVVTADNTGGMLYSGTMLLSLSDGAVRQSLFDRDLWWIRLRLRGGELPPVLPMIRSVLPNLAKVKNIQTMSELFYRSDPDSSLRIELAQGNLLSVRVFVNEEDGNAENAENWVEWRRRGSLEEVGRCCEIDMARGIIEFSRNAFAAYPLKEEEAAVRVDYQSYQGATANVAAGQITSLEESLRFIAGVSNPMPAYGGYDGYSEKTGAAMIANILRTRGRAVTGQDYFDIVSQVSYGVRRIKCLSGVDRQGRRADDVVTVALLIDEYDKGGHIFSSVKDTVRQKLTESGNLLPMGKTLVLCQPCFIRFYARIWLECASFDEAYELQQAVLGEINAFLDPLTGGFEAAGWEIGTLPTVRQLLAWLKMRRPGLSVTRIAMSARYLNQEYTVDEDLPAILGNPFAMAVNGEHTVYVQPIGME